MVGEERELSTNRVGETEILKKQSELGLIFPSMIQVVSSPEFIGVSKLFILYDFKNYLKALVVSKRWASVTHQTRLLVHCSGWLVH